METIATARRSVLLLGGLGLAAAAPQAAALAQTRPPAHGPAPMIYDVRAYGAKGDGKAYDTIAFNRAIADCADHGGGMVYVPAGTFLCFSIHLRSNVELHLAQGCVLVAAESSSEGSTPGPTTGYDAPEPVTAWDAYQDFGHNHWHNSLIWGEDLHDVAITGPGMIWGKGLSHGRVPKPLPAGVGNKSIALKNCRNVQLRDFAVKKGGHFCLLLTGVDNLRIDGLTLDTDRDGMDIDCCRHVTVSNCVVNSPEDDGICLKSSFGLGFARSTDQVAITNCFVTGRYQVGTLIDGTLKPVDMKAATGRIKMGTESNGGFRNIAISNCVLDYCRGIALESSDGALLEDVVISNITMRDMTDTPFFLRLNARMRGPAGVPIGTLRRVRISNLNSYNTTGLYPAIIAGIPGSLIEDVTLSDIYLHKVGGADNAVAASVPDEQVKAYPEPGRFPSMFPAHGLFIRHARNIDIGHIEFRLDKPDARPAVWAEDVHGLDIFRMKTPPATGAANFDLRDVSGFRLFGSPVLADKTLERVDKTTF